jgi:YVTN family beta-propeller protein
VGRALAALVVLVAVLTAAVPAASAGAVPAGPALGTVVSPSLYPTAYAGSANLASGQILTPIDSATNKAGTPLKVKSSISGDVYAAAVSPDGSTIYAVVGQAGGNFGPGQVVPVSTVTGLSGTAIPIGRLDDCQTMIAITPDGSKAYVATTGANTATPINLTTGKAEKAITVGSAPMGLAISPDGATAYVVNNGSGTVTPIDVSTNKAGKAIPVGSGPASIAITPDGTTAYVANSGDNTVTPITLATGTPGTPIPVGVGPIAIAITPDGTTAYVANSFDDTVTPIDVATGAAGSPIPLNAGPDVTPVAIAVSPRGSTVYVVDSSDSTVIPISIATGTAGPPIPVGPEPYSIAFAPGWAAQQTVPSADTAQAPALAEFNSARYAAFTTTSDGIGYSVNNGSGWSPIATVSGTWGSASTSQPSALAVFSGQLYAFWADTTSDDITYSAFNGTTWATPGTVSGTWGTALTNVAPTAAAALGKLWVVWRGNASASLFYSAFDGSVWSSQVLTIKNATTDAPALTANPASSGKPLILAWTQTNSQIGYGELGVIGFVKLGTVPKALTNAAPALAYLGNTHNGTVYLAWKGDTATNSHLWYSSVHHAATSPFNPGDWTGQQTEPFGRTDASPALAPSPYTLYAAWQEQATGNLAYTFAVNPY